jgi:DNA ligase (NAD+)
MIEEFKKIGMKLWQERKVTKGILNGKTFVFTGELRSFTRAQAQRIVENLGGQCRASITKNIDVVVRGQSPGSKYEKAKRFNLTIIGEEEFKKMIKRK